MNCHKTFLSSLRSSNAMKKYHGSRNQNLKKYPEVDVKLVLRHVSCDMNTIQ